MLDPLNAPVSICSLESFIDAAISVGSSQSAATLRSSAITRTSPAGRLASWLVAFLTCLGENTPEQDIVLLVLVFPVIFEVPLDPPCRVGHPRVDDCICQQIRQIKRSTTRIFGGSGSYLPFRHTQRICLLMCSTSFGLRVIWRRLPMLRRPLRVSRGKHRRRQFVSLVNVASTGIDLPLIFCPFLSFSRPLQSQSLSH